MRNDPIKVLQTGWQAELPDLNTSAMATVARINRVSVLVRRRLEDVMGIVGVSLGEFDVLSAMRRSGPPYEMNPSELAKATMLSPGGMTHRLDQLGHAGLLARIQNPKSRRTAPVRLTDEGVRTAEQCARALVAAERAILAALPANEAARLDKTLDALLNHLAQLDSTAT